jgi:hypothetical protein
MHLGRHESERSPGQAGELPFQAYGTVTQVGTASSCRGGVTASSLATRGRGHRGDEMDEHMK